MASYLFVGYMVLVASYLFVGYMVLVV